uniref:Uncharacterized protein n=1 Tax=Candidatus Methanogaster sp. ANME-2c ERB4 TaxID=2759911 RepID=A0A7G9Y5H0_9EURY|nr:hypothetical protein APKMFMID_00001 [Methanosarcinales archaeon ANME-2c ERB4]
MRVYVYAPVLTPDFTIASLMRSLFIAAYVARAFGVTRYPSSSNSKRISRSIASISGIMMSGRSRSTIERIAFASIMLTVYALCATCCAGARSYRSTAIVSMPRRCASITISLPSSPAPNKSSLSEFFSSGAAITSSFFIISCSRDLGYYWV